MDEEYFSDSIIENVAKIFSQYPVFTMINITGELKQSALRENNGNSPLVLTDPTKARSQCIISLLTSL